MAIGSPPITWDLKHTGEPWVYIGTPLPNPSGNTGVMVYVIPTNIINAKVCDDGWMDGYLLLFHPKTAERIWMKFDT